MTFLFPLTPFPPPIFFLNVLEAFFSFSLVLPIPPTFSISSVRRGERRKSKRRGGGRQHFLGRRKKEKVDKRKVSLLLLLLFLPFPFFSQPLPSPSFFIREMEILRKNGVGKSDGWRRGDRIAGRRWRGNVVRRGEGRDDA